MRHLSLRELYEGNLGTPKDMLSKALEMGVRTFDRREKFLYLGKFFMRNLRDI
jgi:hypothetical protein